MSGTPVILMADLNSYAKRQPNGVQKVLADAGWTDAGATAPTKVVVIAMRGNQRIEVRVVPRSSDSIMLHLYSMHALGLTDTLKTLDNLSPQLEIPIRHILKRRPWAQAQGD